jgi:hypothetical protein
MIRAFESKAPFMPSAGHLLSDDDYDAIAAAVMETARGRWFLAEYARRNRHADTAMLLGALRRLEAVVAGQQAALPPDGVRAALAEMVRVLERTKAQTVAAGRPASDAAGRERPGYEFDAVAESQEQATADVLAGAEQVQDIAWTLREVGVDASHCESLEARVGEIYSACARQELAGQGTRRMAAALRFLDGRIGTLLAMAGGVAAPVAPAPTAAAPAGAPAETFTRLAAALVPERPPRDPLGALKALTPEETLALFS